jgi:hypothetical protein
MPAADWLGEREGMVLTCDARDVDLLDGVLVHDFLQTGFGFLVAVLVVHVFNRFYNL